MSNTPKIKRDSEQQEPVRRLSPKGSPKPKVARLKVTGRDPRTGR